MMKQDYYSSLERKIAECPDDFTKEEMADIMGDEDLRGLYETSCRMRTAMREVPAVDVGAEWRRFESRIESRRRWKFLRSRRSMTAFAASLVVFIAIGAAVALPKLKEFASRDPETPNARATESVADDTTRSDSPLYGPVADADVQRLGEDLKFDDAMLVEVVNEIGKRFSCPVVFKDEKLKPLRVHMNFAAGSTIDDIVAAFAPFDEIEVTLENGSLIVK